MLVAAFVVEMLIMLGAPVALWLFLRRKYRAAWGLIAVGALTFVLSQVVHIPLNWGLGLLGGGRGVALWPLPAMAAVAGLSAGICEEVARYLVLRFWRKEARSWAQGLAFGAGHGGIESVLLGLSVLSGFVSMLILRRLGPENLGLSGELLEQTRQQMEAYWAIPWYLPLLGGLERVFAITMHIAWTLLVLQAVVRRNLLWLALAVLAHALVDGLAVGLMRSGVSLPAIEGVVFLLALGALALILALRPRGEVVAAATGE
ncbi:MAG: YhfC family glutamic-type intramembrane protease [Anaerolineae bacterium]